MRAVEVYEFIERRFPQLVPERLTRGRSYFLGRVQRHRDPTNVVQIIERDDGTVKAITMAVSDRICGDGALPLTSLDNLTVAIAKEIALLEQIQREAQMSLHIGSLNAWARR
jgi:hypothetical protein